MFSAHWNFGSSATELSQLRSNQAEVIWPSRRGLAGRMLEGTAERGEWKSYKTRPEVRGGRKQTLENVATNDTHTIAEVEAVSAKLLMKRWLSRGETSNHNTALDKKACHSIFYISSLLLRRQIWLAINRGIRGLWSSSQGRIPVWFHNEGDVQNSRPQLMTLNWALHHENVTRFSLLLSGVLPRAIKRRSKNARRALVYQFSKISIYVSPLQQPTVSACVVVAKRGLGFRCCRGTSRGVSVKIYGPVTRNYVLSRH